MDDRFAAHRGRTIVTRANLGQLSGTLRRRIACHRVGPVGLWIVLGAFAISLILSLVIVAAIGKSPIEAFRLLVEGSIGSPAALANSFVYAAPRLLVALGAIVAIRCGIFNLGGEGQLQFGAVGAALVGVGVSSLAAPFHVLLAVAAAMVFGACWALIAIVLHLWRGANEIIVTLMMNFIAIYFVEYLVQGPMRPADSIYNTSDRVASSAELPVIWPGTRLHLGFALSLVFAVGVWLLLFRTTLGLRLRATGLSPRAARVQGYSTARLMLVSMAISGAVGGIAGATEVLGVQFRLIEGFSSNLGFEGLAIAFLGGLNPLLVVLVAVYFGMIINGTTQLESAMGVPSSLAFIMEALPILFLAAAQGWLFVRARRGSA